MKWKLLCPNMISMSGMEVNFIAKWSSLETVHLPDSILSVPRAWGTDKKQALHGKTASSPDHWHHYLTVKILIGIRIYTLHLQLSLVRDKNFQTKPVCFCLSLESTTTETDERNNKTYFFYRLGTQTGMIVQESQEDASCVARLMVGLILDDGFFQSAKFSLTGFVK